MKWILPLLFLVSVPGCMGIRATKHTYQAAGRSMDVGSAEVSIHFRPEGTRPGSMVVSAMVVGAAFATFDGPFRWRVEAMGDEGVHEWLVVHRIRTKTAKTGRDEWFPAGELGRRASFKGSDGFPGKVRAVYPIPGRLEVKPETDGRLDVWVDLSVRTHSGTVRRTIHLVLDPSVRDQKEMIFLPTEVVESIGKPIEEQDDSMWD